MSHLQPVIRLAGMILAGGKSLRMGRDKATIAIDGSPLIRRTYDVIVSSLTNSPTIVDDIYVVTPWIDRYQPILPTTCQFILEQQPHQGPLVAFAQGLTQITADWVLLLACDLPNLSIPVIETWIAGLINIPPQSIAYLPKNPDGKGWEPLCGFYRQSSLASLQTYLDSGGRSFQGWLATNIVTTISVDDPRCLLNCNTPQDLTAFENG